MAPARLARRIAKKLRRIARTAPQKLRRIAACDLAWSDKLLYALRANRTRYRFQSGASVALRPHTTDAKVFDEIFVEQVYAPCLTILAQTTLPRNLDRVTLIDLGAYTGLSALFFAQNLPVTQIIAVEPDPANFHQLSANLESAGLSARSTAVHAFAGAERAFAQVQDSGNGAWGMRMGPASATGTPVLPLAELAALARTSAPIVLKCDIEGAERQLFLHLHDWEHRIRYIFLELHTEFLSLPELQACLDSSSFRWTIHGAPDPQASITFCSLERGEPRARPTSKPTGNATMKHVCL